MQQHIVATSARRRSELRFIDVAVNLTDRIFEGFDWKGTTKRHESDLDLVIRRAITAGVRHVIITGTSLEQSKKAVAFCRKWNDNCNSAALEEQTSLASHRHQSNTPSCPDAGAQYAETAVDIPMPPLWATCTIGIHPAHADEFLCPDRRSRLTTDAEAALKALKRKSKKRATTTDNQMTAVAARSDNGIDKVAAEAVDEVSLESGHGWDGKDFDRNASDEDQERALRAVQSAHTHAVVSELRQLIEDNRDIVVAVGEIGLDSAELKPGLVTRTLQEETYRLQWQLAHEVGLPVLLHSRACGPQFVSVTESLLRQSTPNNNNTTITPTIGDSPMQHGLIHCFTGDEVELKALLDMGMNISVNAASFRTREGSLLVGSIPTGRLTLETDAPWCDVRPDKDFGARWVDWASSEDKGGLEGGELKDPNPCPSGSRRRDDIDGAASSPESAVSSPSSMSRSETVASRLIASTKTWSSPTTAQQKPIPKKANKQQVSKKTESAAVTESDVTTENTDSGTNGGDVDAGGFVRGMFVARRNEPCHIYHVAEMVLGARELYHAEKRRHQCAGDSNIDGDSSSNEQPGIRQQQHQDLPVIPASSLENREDMLSRLTDEIFETTLSTFPKLAPQAESVPPTLPS